MDWSGLLSDMTAAVRDTFGEPVSYWRHGTPEDGWISETPSGEPLHGIFDPEGVALEAGGGVAMNASAPVLEMRLDDLGFEPDEDDKVRIAGVTYRVTDAPPSSSRTVKLQLRR